MSAEQEEKQDVADQEKKQDMADQEKKQDVVDQENKQDVAEQENKQDMAEQEKKQDVAEQEKKQDVGEQEKQDVAEQEKQDEDEEMEEDEEGDWDDDGEEVDMKCQLYLKFTDVVPPIDEVKALHPDIIRVTMRKQRKPKFCFLIFSTPEKAKHAKKELSNIVYKNQGHLFVEYRTTRRHRMDPKKWLIAYGFPDNATDTEVKQEFLRFGCGHCHLYKRYINDKLQKGSAKLIFNTAKDSEDFLNNVEAHVFKGCKLSVEYLKTKSQAKVEKQQKRKQRRKEKRKEYENRVKKQRTDM